jgi:anthranilate synthase component 1
MPKTIYQPSLADFRTLAQGEANLIPVYREFPADLETPVSVYIKLMDEQSPSFLLESVEGGERVGRYSFVGINPQVMKVLRHRTVSTYQNGEVTTESLSQKQDILQLIEEELDLIKLAKLPGLPRFVGGAAGYLGYDVVRDFEDLPATAIDVLDLPDAVFLLADTLVVFDHARHRLLILANAEVSHDIEGSYVSAIQRIEVLSEKLYRPLPAIPYKRWGLRTSESGRRDLTSNKSQEQYEAIVSKAKEYIFAGDIFQVVLSQRVARETDAHPFAIYRALRMLNPSPYMFYFDFSVLDLQLIGASPEMHVRLEDGVASVRPIAGTRRRGSSPAEDDALAAELLADEKEKAEHVMLVDLGRNDLGRVCEYGSVQVKELMVIERYSHVMHIVSHVEGNLRSDMNAYDLMRATFPAGTVSGAPKVRAMEIIEELEEERRGIYAGVVGYFGYDGSMDTCIAIRTLLMKRDKLYVQAGAGIVADSHPASEHRECLNKASALLAAVQWAEDGDF